jgi:glycosyltransferase involved in cell wall biosynthesis
MKTVSVITVVYNGCSVIKETIESVLGQTYPHIEYIVIDGGSSDGTVRVIQPFLPSLSHFETRKDRGIYHAMNKGIARASGDWICFMNAGDRFFTPNAVKEIMFSLSPDAAPDIVYGNHEVRYPGGARRIELSKPLDGIWKGSRFSHQSALICSRLHKTEPYSENNPICADYEFFYRAYANGRKFVQVPVTIASVESGGVSDRKRIKSILGRWHIIDKSAGRGAYYLAILLLEILKWPLKRLLGQIGWFKRYHGTHAPGSDSAR